MAIVYQHRRTDTNEIFYIGIGKKESRPYSKHNRGKFWKDFTKNHSYTVEILYENISWEEACEIEKRLIKEIGRRDLGLGPLINMTDGGDGAPNLSEHSRKKMATQKGKTTWIKGLNKDSDIRVKKISDKLKGKIRSKQHCENISKSKTGKSNGHLGINHSEETKNKIKNAQLGNKYRLGTKHSESSKDVMKQKALNRKKFQCAHCKKVIDISNYTRWHGDNCKNKSQA